MCSGFTHQHTVEETHPRSQTVKPSSPLSSSPYLLCDSILPSLSLNTLPSSKLSFSFLLPLTPTPPLRYQSSPSPSASPPPCSPEDSIMLSLLVSLMSFTCQQRRECASSSPTKEKHPPVIPENAARRRGGGQGGRSTGGQGELDNTGSGIKRKMLRE